MKLRIAALVLLVAICPACRKQESGDEKKGSGGESVRSTVETMVQYDTLRTGRRAQERVKQITADHNAELDEVMTD